MGRIRIGAVSYLNTKPLVYGLMGENMARQECEYDVELSFDLPSRLADQLGSAALDVALVPSIEAFENPDYTVVSDACIACRGPVWSVKFLSRVPMSEIESVSLDEGSRTSAAMTKIMLDDLGLHPEFYSLPIDADWRDSQTDAMLIIGDRAMQLDSKAESHADSNADSNADGRGASNDPFQRQFVSSIDMGQWWLERTGLPFVFAMWTARSSLGNTALDFISKTLSCSRDQGLAHLRAISQSVSRSTSRNTSKGVSTACDLSEERCFDYLNSNLHFQLGETEKNGLQRFHEEAVELGLSTLTHNLNFHEYDTVKNY